MRWLLIVCMLIIAGGCQRKPPADENRRVATVWRIIDGDTVEMLDGQTVDLAFIDAPEINQPYGVESTFALAQILRPGDAVLIETIYGGKIPEVVLYHEQMEINYLMVRGGHAWHCIKGRQLSCWWDLQSRSDAERYTNAELNALRDRLGLWRGQNQTPPWEWREKNKSE